MKLPSPKHILIRKGGCLLRIQRCKSGPLSCESWQFDNNTSFENLPK